MSGSAIAGKDVGRVIKGWKARLRSKSFAPALRKMKKTGERDIERNFREGRRSTGAKWPPRRRKYPWPILIKTGTLMRSTSQEGASGHYETVGTRTAASGTTVFYAKFHQFGTKLLPPRQFEEVADAAVDEMAEQLADWILDNVFN